MCRTMFFKKMPSELQKLKRAMGEICRARPSSGGRYNTVVEDPFKSGYISSSMSKERRLRLEAAGFRVGSTENFLKLLAIGHRGRSPGVSTGSIKKSKAKV